MNRFSRTRRVVVAMSALALGLSGGLLAAMPASASVSAFGGTFDVFVAGPGTPSIFSATTYVHIDTTTQLIALIGPPSGANIDVQLRDAANLAVASCTIVAGNATCPLSPIQLVAGSQTMSILATNGSETHSYPVTLFGVTPTNSAQSTPGLDWKDARGVWHDGTGTGLYMLADQVTECRFRLTNNTNAPLQVNSFFLNTVSTGSPVSIPAGATHYFPCEGPGKASTLLTSMGGSWSFTDAAGYGNGNGTGGGIAGLPGTATLSATSGDRGATVTLTGTGFTAPPLSAFSVEFNSTPIPLGNVTADVNGAFSLTFAVPASAAPGAHSVTLMNGTYAVAALPFSVNGLAVTGVDAAPYVVIALALLLAGILVLIVRYVVRRRS